jgi:hypothetical protein
MRLRARCLLALVFAACLGLPERSQAQPARPADYIVVVVNSEPITNSEVRARLTRIEQQLARERTAGPPRAELIQASGPSASSTSPVAATLLRPLSFRRRLVVSPSHLHLFVALLSPQHHPRVKHRRRLPAS